MNLCTELSDDPVELTPVIDCVDNTRVASFIRSDLTKVKPLTWFLVTAFTTWRYTLMSVMVMVTEMMKVVCSVCVCVYTFCIGLYRPISRG